MNTLFIACISIFSAVHGHGDGAHPIGKLIRGTFASYDGDGAEFARLYVCRTSGGRYSSTIIRTTDNFENYMIGHATFSKADIDYDNDVISNIRCIYQQHGRVQEVTPCTFDVSALCDHKEISLSFTFEQQTVSLDFVKISLKYELLGNDDLNGYQCGIPYSQDEAYPFSYTSDPFSWAPAITEVEVYTEDEGANCWAYLDAATGDPLGDSFGSFSHRQRFYGGAMWTMKWDDQTLPNDDPCHKGSQMNVRVDEDVVLVAWECSNGLEGAGYLAYKTNDYDSCPVGAAVGV